MSGTRFSIIPARAIDDPRFRKNRAALLVLCAIGTYGDRDGWCHPALTTIANRLDVSKQSVAKQIGLLIDFGYLEKQANYRPNGSQTSNKYRILFDPILDMDQLQEADGRQPSEVDGGQPLEVDPINDPVNDPKKRDEASASSPLAPNSPGALLLFEELNKNQRANKRRAMVRFKSVQQKDEFEKAEERLGMSELRKAIHYALVNGRTSISSVMNTIRKWNTGPRPTSIPSTNGRQTHAEKVAIIQAVFNE